MNKVRILALLSLVLLAGCSGGPAPVSPQPTVIKEGMVEVTVRVHGITDSRGMIHCGVFRSSENWMSPTADYAKSMPVGEVGQVVELVIPDVPSGFYSFSLYQDLEGNKTLSRNSFGIPTDPWGISNDAATNFGPPSFEDASVVIEPPSTTIDVTLREGLGMNFEPANRPFDV